MIEQNHDRDHIHLLVLILPKMSVGNVVRIIKSNTARDLKNNTCFLKNAIGAITKRLSKKSLFYRIPSLLDDIYEIVDVL